ncbi:MAG: hypothetical protein ACLVAT_04980 [Lachnospiraceae bacterium]
MRRQTEEWHPTGIQVAGEKKIKIESRRRQQKHGVLLRCVYLYLCMVGTILTFRLDLGMKFRVLPVAGVLLLFVLLVLLKSIWRPWGRWVYRGAYLLIFLTGGLGWKHLAAGWQAAENSIRHQLSVYYGVTLAEKTPLLSGERGELLLIVIFALFFWSMETAVVRKGRAGLLVASEILIVLLELMCGCRFLQPGIFLIRRISAGIARDGTKPWSKQSADPLSFRAVGRRAGSLPVTSGRTSRFDAGKTDKRLE